MEQEVMNQEENLASQQEQEINPYQEDYQLANNPFKVTKVSLDTDFEEPVQESIQQEELPEAQPEPTQQGNVDDIEALRAKLAEMEQRLSQNPEPQTKVEYRLPDEVKEILDNPGVLNLLHTDYSQKSVVELIKEAFKEANPWAKTDRHVESHLRKQYPDIDFDMDDLGLAEEEYDAIAWQAEGIRQQRISQQQELRTKIENAKAPEVPEVDVEGYQKQFTELVESGIQQLKPADISLDIPGYKLPTVDAEKIRDIVYSDAVPLSLDTNGNVWPNLKAAAAMAELEMLKSQIPAMLEAARRAAPKEAIEAINKSLNNQVTSPNPGPMDSKQILSGNASINGMRIIGIQSNF